jgi:hypothetical protein
MANTMEAKAFDELTRDIDYALRRARPPLKFKDESQSRIAARQVAEHLMLANWRIERGPPTKPHSAPGGVPGREAS